MGAPQYEQAGADIGGTGTTNTIPRWTGPSTLGDSGITDNGSTVSFVGRNLASTAAQTWTLASSTAALNIQSGLFNIDTTNSRVGVGTTTPARKFDVNGGIRIADANPLEWGGTAYAIVGDNAGALYFKTASAERLRIDLNGNVGIGTASPAGKLEVSGAGDQTVWITATSAGSTTLSLYPSGGGLAQINAVGASNLAFRTNGTERARIDSNGNIYGTSGTTGMTNGFFYIAAAAGAPTGTPTAVSGRVPMYYDTTNNEFYVYNGAWKKVTLA